jgi:hypothetical protein
LLGFRGLGAQKRLPIGYRDLIVVGVDFAEGKETVTVSAILDESSLEGWFYAGYPREIDVSFELLLVLRLEIEFLDAVTAYYDNPRFLRVGGVYKHFVGHYFVSRRQPPAAARRKTPAAASQVSCRILLRPLAEGAAPWRCRPQPNRRGILRTFP